ncbi:MAG: hypothetical protein IT305_27425 [Chloroflexi bacterium]|nr:hypothetical protein [Chloroflexota bacterium]
MNLAIAPSFISVIILVVGALVVLGFVPALTRNPQVLMTIGMVSLIVAIVPVLPALNADGLTLLIVATILVLAAVAMLLVPGTELEEIQQFPEIAALLLVSAAGAIMFATADGILSAAIGLETLSLSGATMVALSQGRRAVEAAFKYFALAAVSFSVMLFGIGLVFLSTGSFGWPTFSAVDPAFRWLLVVGVLMLGLGFAYELTLIPLHWGAVDAYTVGAPSLSGYVMAMTKIAAVVALGRLLAGASQGLATPLALPLTQMLIVIGVLSIIWGTFAALAQREMRRMLAYSAVANAGFLALALGCGAEGRSAAIFYAVIYTLSVILVFATLAGRGTGALLMSDLKREPMGVLRAVALAIGLLSLASVPPTPGFWAKLAVLHASWITLGWIPTAIAALGGVFGALYYLRPLPDAFAIARATGARLPFSPAPAVLLAGAATVILAIAPGLIYAVLAAGF